MDPTIPMATTSELAWASYVRQWIKMASEDPTYEMGHMVHSTLLNEKMLPNHNICDAVNPGMASKPTYDRQQNNKDHRMNGLVKDGYGDSGQNVSEASEFGFAQNSHKTTTKVELAQFHHQTLFSPPITTIVSAIENDQLSSFSGLEKALLNHLPISSATIKGHMHKQRKGLRSTRANQG